MKVGVKTQITKRGSPKCNNFTSNQRMKVLWLYLRKLLKRITWFRLKSSSILRKSVKTSIKIWRRMVKLKALSLSFSKFQKLSSKKNKDRSNRTSKKIKSKSLYFSRSFLTTRNKTSLKISRRSRKFKKKGESSKKPKRLNSKNKKIKPPPRPRNLQILFPKKKN